MVAWEHAIVALTVWWACLWLLSALAYRRWPWGRWDYRLLFALLCYLLVSGLFGTLSTYQLADDVVTRGEAVPSIWEYTWQFGAFALIWPATPFILAHIRT